MRICYLADCNHRNTLNWAGYFSKHLNHEVHIISLNKNLTIENGINFHHVKTFFYKNKLKYIFAQAKIKKVINQIKPDILIGYRITSYGFISSTLNFNPLVIAAQGQNIVWPEKHMVKKYAAKYAIQKADLIHSWASHMSEKLLELGAKQEKILTVPKGVDTELFYPRNSIIHSYERDTIKIISTRALKKEYDHDILLTSLCKLKNCFRINFHLTIVGDGDNKKKLKKMAECLKINDNITFTGQIDYEKVAEKYRSSDIYISTVETDGVSSSMLEAMSCGLIPIVVKNIANMQWIKDGINGYLYEAKDSNKLVQKIIIATQKLEDFEELRKKNRKLINNKFSIKENMKIFEKNYKKLIEKYKNHE